MVDSKYKSKINPRNKESLNKLKTLLETFKIVGIVDVTSLPAPQFQKIRSSLKGKAEIFIVKKNIIEIFFKESESKYNNLSKLLENSNGIIGIIFTNDNPFKIFKTINKNKSKAPAKAGQIAPNEIIVPAGPTSFSPGPIIGELGALKIKAGINAGKVEIKEDSLVANEGDVISPELAGVLSRLDINPMEVGLSIKSLYENGVIYDKSVLDVDEEAILNNLKLQAQRSFNLAMGIGYITKQNISILIGKANRDSLGLGLGIDYASNKTIKKLIVKASNQKNGLSNEVKN